MANEVYANGREIACKAGAGKTVAAFPDVCLSPPSPPAGPIPIPYPNTAYASDTHDGSRTVQISGQEVMLKDSSTFKKSTGDEAATKSLGMGVITHQITGEVSFAAWSMDVKIEGENVDRHLDMTLHNEQSLPDQTPPWPFMDSQAVETDPCATDKQKEHDACSEHRKKTKTATKQAQCADPNCRAAQKCRLIPQREGCCEGQNAHHLIEDNWIKDSPDFPWYRSTRSASFVKPTEEEIASGVRTEEDAPCVCADGDKWREEHGEFHVIQGQYARSFLPGGSREAKAWDFQAAKNGGLMAHDMVYDGNCQHDCIEAQVDNFYGDNPDRTMNIPDLHPMNEDPDRGWTGQEAQQYINPEKLTQNLPI
jgi:hypothetical protein